MHNEERIELALLASSHSHEVDHYLSCLREGGGKKGCCDFFLLGSELFLDGPWVTGNCTVPI